MLQKAENDEPGKNVLSADETKKKKVSAEDLMTVLRATEKKLYSMQENIIKNPCYKSSSAKNRQHSKNPNIQEFKGPDKGERKPYSFQQSYERRNNNPKNNKKRFTPQSYNPQSYGPQPHNP